MKITSRIFICPVLSLALIGLLSCGGDTPDPTPEPDTPVVDPEAAKGPSYTNPVIDQDCPDPSIIDNRERDGYFYAYSTRNGSRYIPIYRSKDMIHWEDVGAAFTIDGRPTWLGEDNLNFWAPDINYINGKYVLYYAIGGASLGNSSGVAVSDSPTGPFEDKGCIVGYKSTNITKNVDNSIDPYYYEEDGKKYLIWGGYGTHGGIHIVELEDDGLSVKAGTAMTQIGATNMEGSLVYKRGKYYYLICSKDNCCAAANVNKYHLVVGRSTNILGPYTDPEGKKMTDSGYEYTLLKGTLEFIGPGHNSEIIEDDAGLSWFCYHAYCSSSSYRGRRMCLQQIHWSGDDWPTIIGSQPCSGAKGPYFE